MRSPIASAWKPLATRAATKSLAGAELMEAPVPTPADGAATAAGSSSVVYRIVVAASAPWGGFGGAGGVGGGACPTGAVVDPPPHARNAPSMRLSPTLFSGKIFTRAF